MRDATRVIVAVAAIATGAQLTRCLESIAEQSCEGLDFGVALLFDGLDAAETASGVLLPAAIGDRTWVLLANCGSAPRSRNALLEFVDLNVAGCRWVARLDSDDRFAAPDSLATAVAAGEASGVVAVLGGNRVVDREGRLLRLNPATSALVDPTQVLLLLGAMAEGNAENEIPSCNLLLRAQSGLRYPDMASAEDHWLVADLLIHRPGDVAVVAEPLFADYAVNGPATVAAKGAARYAAARRALYEAATAWIRVQSLPGRILGHGQEAIVREYDWRVFKHFYRGILKDEKVAWLAQSLGGTTAIPAPTFDRDEGSDAWVATYPFKQTTAFDAPDEHAVECFLLECLRLNVVCANIKRSNFRVGALGELIYIDVGNWIIPMDVSYFRDASARLFAIGVLGWSDEELLRRRGDHSRAEIWERLPGFSAFYGRLVETRIREAWASAPSRPRSKVTPCNPEVTLVIKACAMDARFAREQIVHIVDQLAAPSGFAERVLLVDPFTGPFLRQHDAGDLEGLMETARTLVAAGVLDRIVVGPSDAEEIRQVNARWFAVDCAHTHSSDDVPVTPQVWAFDGIATRYVLQCDLDVLVGRRRRDHDYLAEMLAACEPDDVVCVAFNIPHASEDGFNRYDAPPGEYKPEVRLGLLDLHRLRRLRPLPATVVNGRIGTTWYRALHAVQRRDGLRTVRGGHPDTFYLHPPNVRKGEPCTLGRIRDLVAQGIVPVAQLGQWDLVAPDEDWRYPARFEDVVVLARGRNTPVEKVERFATGLRMQDDQSFGVVVIDDASVDMRPSHLQEALGWLGDRLTLVRHSRPRGRAQNNLLGVTGLCGNPMTMIVVVDLDDALADRAAIGTIRGLAGQGHDVVLAAPFRPDVPTKVYRPCFDRARATFGGDVWIHLRAFRKALFDALPADAMKLDGDWIENHDDYATMVPIVERSASPIYVPRYLYWHQRTTVLDKAGMRLRDATIMRILGLARVLEGES